MYPDFIYIYNMYVGGLKEKKKKNTYAYYKQEMILCTQQFKYDNFCV